MRKKYVSPLVEALDLELEDVLYDSALDNEEEDDFGGDFDGEDEDFDFFGLGDF